MITEDKINANFLLFVKKLQAYGCYSEEMQNEIGEKIKYAPYSGTDEYGGCYNGGLIDVTLHKLCRIAYEINEKVFGKNGEPDKAFAHPMLAVNTNKLMKVLLLLNLSKAVMFTDETEQWKIKKGLMYKFNEFDTNLKIGARTLFLCQKYGIKLEEDEYEAILANDDVEDNSIRYRTPLYILTKTARFFTMVELKQEWNSQHPAASDTIEK